ncbi:MAG: nucleotidyltransferase family protein [Gammaproteobacteria bacterium]
MTALILAGDRSTRDPVRLAAGTVCKALATVAGRPMLLRVLAAIDAVSRIGKVILCGPPPEAVAQLPELQDYIAAPRVCYVPDRATLAESVEAGLAASEVGEKVLLTTADNVLLSPAIVEHFISAALQTGADICIGLVRYDTLRAQHPEVKRTVLKFSDAHYCGCNLYFIGSDRGRQIITFWRRIQQHRKRPWLMLLKLFGLLTVLRYLSGLLSAPAALRAVGRKTDLRVSMVEVPFAEAGIDVDSAADLALVERILSGGEAR